MAVNIAAICLAHDAMLLTRRLSAFQHIPGLSAENWHKEVIA